MDTGRTGLAQTLAHVCGLHFGGAAKSPGSHGDPLQPHRKVAFMPSGGYCTYCPPGVPGDRVLPCDVKTWPAPAASPVRTRAPRDAESACALCVRSLDLPKPSSVAARVFSGLVLHLGESGIRPGKCFVPREILDADPAGFVSAVVSKVRAHEDDLCLKELGSMEEIPWGAGRDGRPVADALIESLEATSAGRPRGTRPGTVLLSRTSLARLLGPASGLAGGSKARGWDFRAHHAVPDGVAYAIPPAGGPTLLRGPTAIHCGSEGFDVRHYCTTEAGSGGGRVALPGGGAAG